MEMAAGVLRLLFMVGAFVMQVLGNVARIDAGSMYVDIETTGKHGKLQSEKRHQGQKTHTGTVIPGSTRDKEIDDN